ncbi:MAG: collagen-like protein [Lachnospiraceae bacterium]|nr:collagen-like protein [Lachnospiraceae bacterium]
MARNKLSLDIKKIKNKSWYKPVSIICTICMVALLVIGSAYFAKTSVKKTTTDSKYSYSDVHLSGDVNEELTELTYLGKNTSNNTSTGAKVVIDEEKIEKQTELNKEVKETTGYKWNANANLGTAAELEKIQGEITTNIMHQVNEKLEDTIVGATGAAGAKGEKGDKGEDGKNGLQGKTGATGAKGEKGDTGATGAKGEKGAQGIQGEKGATGAQGAAGKDGTSSYIAYADDANGTNFSRTPLPTSKYFGTCSTANESDANNATKYKWQEYRPYIITYSEENGVPTVTIQ